MLLLMLSPPWWLQSCNIWGVPLVLLLLLTLLVQGIISHLLHLFTGEQLVLLLVVLSRVVLKRVCFSTLTVCCGLPPPKAKLKTCTTLGCI